MVFALTKLRIIGEPPKLSGCSSLWMSDRSLIFARQKSINSGKCKRKTTKPKSVIRIYSHKEKVRSSQ